MHACPPDHLSQSAPNAPASVVTWHFPTFETSPSPRSSRKSQATLICLFISSRPVSFYVISHRSTRLAAWCTVDRHVSSPKAPPAPRQGEQALQGASGAWADLPSCLTPHHVPAPSFPHADDLQTQYELKGYKKGLKAADTILKKFPNHGGAKNSSSSKRHPVS